MTRPAYLLLCALVGLGLGLAAGDAGAAEEAGGAPRLAAAQSRLAIRLMRALPPGDTVAVSPASLAAVAGALDLGASSAFREAMHDTLGFADGDASSDFAALRAGLRAAGAASGPLRLSDLLLVDDGFALYPGIPLAFAKEGLSLDRQDFRNPATLGRINAWVKDRTAGLIPSILDELPGNASLVALSALHFKDRWRTPFDKAETRQLPFRSLRGPDRPVAMMSLPEGRYAFRRDDRFVAIDLPFADGRTRLVVVTTSGGEPARLRRFASVGPWLAGEGFREVQGDLRLPAFSLSQKSDLTAPLDRLGLRRERQSPAALAGFGPDGVRLSRVVQRVEMTVDEDGAEAAAATAAVMERSIASEFIRMKVDRPFVFALRDAPTGLLLVAGYVSAPPPAPATAER
jgi:serpin B